MTLELLIKRLDTGLTLPRKAHEHDAGLDLISAIDISLKPGERILIPTGIAVAIPTGHAGYVQPRSGLAITRGLGIVNSPGLIDSGYRGEISVIAINLDQDEAIDINRGEKIAQLVVLPVPEIRVVEADSLPDSQRGTGGFGSTGA
ncbi:MAG: dUTP diphosphatase [Actinomycetota bacterium]